jgi:hypothetical protein
MNLILSLKTTERHIHINNTYIKAAINNFAINNIYILPIACVINAVSNIVKVAITA